MRKYLIILLILNSLFSTAQEQQQAFDYFRKGEYEKAASIYKSLFEKNPYNSYYLLKLIDSHQQLEKFSAAEELIKSQLKNQPTQSQFLVELGYNFELQHQQEKAIGYYNKALKELDRNQYSSYTIAKAFQNNHLLDFALIAYKKGMKDNQNANYTFQIASIYGEQGDLKNMFDTYLNAIDLDEKNGKIILRYIGNFITDDNKNESNILFKNLILKRVQSSPKNAWNELLSWLFTQQKDFSKAFIQEKALYKRTLHTMNGIVNVGELAFDNEDY